MRIRGRKYFWIRVCFWTCILITIYAYFIDEILFDYLRYLWKYMTDFDYEAREHDDPLLVQFIRQKILFSRHHPVPYILDNASREFDQDHGNIEMYKDIFGDKKQGFFIEVAAYAVNDRSPTRYWEKERNWTGLQIEAHPEHFATLARRYRRADLLQACLSPNNSVATLTFRLKGSGSRFVPRIRLHGDLSSCVYFRATCFPLAAILDALGNPTVHFFLMSIESLQLDILRTLDFLKHDIRVFAIDYSFLEASHEELVDHMAANGYRFHGRMGVDAVFVKNGVHLERDHNW